MGNKTRLRTIKCLLTFMLVLSFIQSGYGFFEDFVEEPNTNLIQSAKDDINEIEVQEDTIVEYINTDMPIEPEYEDAPLEAEITNVDTSFELLDPVLFNSDSIVSQQDIIDAIANTDSGAELILIVDGNISLSEPILINKSLSIIIRGNGSLTTTGAFRHFSTGNSSDDGTKIADVHIAIESGVTLNGNSQGGGIHLNGANCSFTLNGGIIKNCATTKQNGGGIYVSGDKAQYEKGSIKILDGEIYNCEAISGGGGIYASYCDVLVSGGIIRNNYAPMGGGICAKDGTALTIEENGKITENEAIGSAGCGGGVYVQTDTTVTMLGGEISWNKAGEFGGGIAEPTSDSGSSIYINGGEIKGNSTRNYGGGIASLGPLDVFEINGGYITGNSALIQTGSNQGGGVYVSGGGTLRLTGGEIFKNEAGSGGGIFIAYSHLIVEDGAIIYENETTSGAGGGIRIYAYGAGNDPGATIILNGGKIYDNLAFTDGGGIALSYRTLLTINDGEISGNQAVNGGGIVVSYFSSDPQSSKIQFNKGHIINNTAKVDGGGIWIHTPDLKDVKAEADAAFYGNTASAGYALEDSATILLHHNQIKTDSFTVPFTFAYSNYDINYRDGALVYIITFEPKGGTAVPAVLVKVGDTIISPISTREGYTFDGWYMEDETINPWDFDSGVTGNMTLYAKWSAELSTPSPTPVPTPEYDNTTETDSSSNQSATESTVNSSEPTFPAVLTPEQSPSTTLRPEPSPLATPMQETINEPASPDIIVLDPDEQLPYGNYIIQPSETDDSVFLVFDSEGIQLGHVNILDGMTINDIDLENDIIPLGQTETKENPVTGDRTTHLPSYGITLICIIIAVLCGYQCQMKCGK